MKKLKEILGMGFLSLAMGWILFAFCFDVFMITLSFTNEKKADEISKQIMWKIDGTFKNDPDNIWYDGPEKN